MIRHRYNPETRQFVKDETIVKIEKKPFTHGAMRHCFRVSVFCMGVQVQCVPFIQFWLYESLCAHISTHVMYYFVQMKKLATPPQSASNHRFHSYGW